MTKPARTARLVAGLLVLLSVLAGCTTAEPAPDPPPPSWAAGTPRQTVVDVADDLKDLVIATYPDLTITPEDQVLDPSSRGCSSSPGFTGERIMWSSAWALVVEPKQDTVPLLGDIVDQLVAQGWELRDSPTTPDFLRELDRDGYYLTIAGHFEEARTFPARISFTVYSPCLDNPDK